MQHCIPEFGNESVEKMSGAFYLCNTFSNVITITFDEYQTAPGWK